MARIRSLHPGFFTDEAIVSVSAFARLLLQGLWVEADDHGIFEWKPVTIKMRVLPVDNVDVGLLLSELSAAGLIREFADGARQYGAVRNFCRFQRPKKPKYIHPIRDEFRTYVASSGASGEPGEVEAGSSSPLAAPEGDPVPKKGELAPQMKEEGGKERKKESAGLKPANGRDHKPDLADPKTQFYARAKELLGPSSGGLATKLLEAKGGSVAKARAALETASERADAREYLGAIIRGKDPPKTEFYMV